MFKIGDIVLKIKEDCMGCMVGQEYEVVKDYSGDLMLVDVRASIAEREECINDGEGCHCNNNSDWKFLRRKMDKKELFIKSLC